MIYPAYQASLIQSQLEKLQPSIMQLQQSLRQVDQLNIHDIEKINAELPSKIHDVMLGQRRDIQINFQSEFGGQAVILYIPIKQQGRIVAWQCKTYNANVLMLPRACLKNRVN